MTQDDLKTMATDDLLAIASDLFRTDPESEQVWEAIGELRKRDPNEIFSAAAEFCESEDKFDRQLGADLLYLGWNKNETFCFPKKTESVPILSGLLDDPEPEVVYAAICTLGHLGEFTKIFETRDDLLSHGSPLVRNGVATFLAYYDDPSSAQIIALITLTQDEDEEVRNWATFGLGTQCDSDTPEIREALLARVEDSHHEARGEALVGLARRRDQRVIKYIKAELESDCVGKLAVTAAGQIASNELVETLEDLQDWWDVDTELLEGALKRCKGVPSTKIEDSDSFWDMID